MWWGWRPRGLHSAPSSSSRRSEHREPREALPHRRYRGIGRDALGAPVGAEYRRTEARVAAVAHMLDDPRLLGRHANARARVAELLHAQRSRALAGVPRDPTPRGPEQLRRRLANARSELRAAAEFDRLVVNDRIEDAVAEVSALVEKGLVPDRRLGAAERRTVKRIIGELDAV